MQISIVPFQSSKWCFYVSEWCVFWLLSKDALRLSSLYSVDPKSQAYTEMDVSPIESLAKLTLFRGNFFAKRIR